MPRRRFWHNSTLRVFFFPHNHKSATWKITIIVSRQLRILYKSHVYQLFSFLRTENFFIFSQKKENERSETRCKNVKKRETFLPIFSYSMYNSIFGAEESALINTAHKCETTTLSFRDSPDESTNFRKTSNTRCRQLCEKLFLRKEKLFLLSNGVSFTHHRND